MKKFQFPSSNVVLLPALEQVAVAFVNEIGEEMEEGTDLVSYFCDNYMESLSIAGYSETRPNDRRSMRAFGRLLKLDAAGEKRLRQEVGYNRSVYRRFGFASLVTEVLAISPQYAIGLKEAYNGSISQSKGPFGDSDTLFLNPHLIYVGRDYQSEVGDLPDTREEFEGIWLNHLVNEYSRVTAVTDEDDKAKVEFASVVRVGDIDTLVRKLTKRGLTSEAGLTLAVAETIINALRVNQSFIYGIRSSQFTAKDKPA